jgi:hypothetical protein
LIPARTAAPSAFTGGFAIKMTATPPSTLIATGPMDVMQQFPRTQFFYFRSAKISFTLCILLGDQLRQRQVELW